MDRFSIEDLRKRHSVRSFLLDPIAPDIRKKLEAQAASVTSQQAGLRFQLCFDDDSPFRGFTRSYGMFRNARNYLCVVIEPASESAEERAGYFAERFVLLADSLGLGCCIVSGTFSRGNTGVNVEPGEKVPFVVVFGYPGGKESVVARISKSLIGCSVAEARSFFIGSDEEYDRAVGLYPYLPDGLEGMALAPSAANKRPARVRLAADGSLDFFTVGTPAPIDLGIAEANFDIAASLPARFTASS